jgi:bifunctional non-homologous end joining protein LigD
MTPAARAAAKATPTSKLATYRTKRDPQKTPEPMGATKSRKQKAKEPTFVIQEHHARALHWDFRLERGGVLVSWALPKGLPVDPKTNHLAVHVEDHPLDYGGFEGVIPKGEYGAGQVTIWDKGTYETEKWRDDEVIVHLHGERSSGRFVLFSTGGNKWMIHRMDPAPADFEAMPTEIAPMLAKMGDVPTDGAKWAYEFKWDGIRAIVYVEGGRVRALTRNAKPLGPTFPELNDIGLHLGSTSAVLDGEIVALDDQGRPNFSALAHRLHLASKAAVDKAARLTPASFFAFDLLYLNGHSLVALPYDERRRLLEALKLQGETFATPISVTGKKAGDVIAVAAERGLEGVVIKRRDSPYESGQRSGDWIKIKSYRAQEVVIGGWTNGKGGLARTLGALLLGIPDGKQLTYVGKVGTGFTRAQREELLGVLAPLARKTSPFDAPLSPSETALAHFVRPSLVGEVSFAEWTPDGHLRQPAWRGIRTDKTAREVVRES